MSGPRIFGVDYQYLSCGSVFTDGFVHAAHDLGVPYAHALWDAPNLPQQIATFNPDLLWVTHGRKFSRRLPNLARQYRSAVFLTDEPYETDECSTWSSRFDHVFVNDPGTLHRHKNASYLPVCYDPHRQFPSEEPLKYLVGFIGGGNRTRDRYLAVLAHANLLSYVVGGTWSEPSVNAVCHSRNITPDQTAAYYRATRIVLNVFREVHHYNRQQIQATSLNPRVYEALACGALVVSEWRPEIDTIVPELPTFRTAEECVSLVAGLLADPVRAEAIRVQCQARLAGHTYAARLQTVIDVALGQREAVA